MSDLKQLQELAKNFKLLYVQDAKSQDLNTTKFLKKLFSTTYVASGALDGWELFKKYRPHFVIIDLETAYFDGINLAKKMKHALSTVKIIIMSVVDEKEYLYQAIEIGVFGFIKKPIGFTELTNTVSKAIVQINQEIKEKKIQAQLRTVFNYQSSMIVMLHQTKPVIANQAFLDYYGLENVKALNIKFEDIGSEFLEDDGFLYNNVDGNWLDKVLADKSKIHNLKMKNNDGKIRHFILKCNNIPDNNKYDILSFDDITELNLLGLLDEDEIQADDKKTIYNLLSIIKQKNAQVSLHNYYKGITIANDSSIVEIKDESVVFKTSYVQQKAVQLEKKSLIVSEALPYPVNCATLNSFSFEKQTVEFEDLEFLEVSPVTRESIRLVPEETHKITMQIREIPYGGDLRIEDISLNAVRLSLNVLPAGFEINTEVTLNMVFTVNRQPIIINTQATLFRKKEEDNMFEAVFILKLDAKTRMKVVNYITKRQMAIIREFKGLQNG